jgi:hypothetical protein
VLGIFETYIRFLAMRMHFTQDGYDGFKYNFKVKATQESFLQRSDRYSFHKLSRHPDPDGLMVSNLFTRDDAWVTDLFDARAEKIRVDMNKRQGSLTYNLRNELSSVKDFRSALAVKDGQYPEFVRMYIGKNLSPESLIAIDSVTNAFEEWDKRLTDVSFWPRQKMKLIKYKPFLAIKKDEIRKIVLDIFPEM